MSEQSQGLAFLCFGIGAIGTYIGGSLAASGQRVVFIERPEVADEVRQRGLHLEVGEEAKHVERPVVVSSLPEALDDGPFDVAILAVKSYDTAGVMAQAGAVAGQMPPVLCLQNGVENETIIAKTLGERNVIRGSVTTAVGRQAAGDIQVEKLRGVGVALDHGLGPALVSAFNQAGLHARGYPHGEAMKWSKMITNLLANASSAILDLPPAAIFSHPGLYRVEVQMAKEALAVMAAHQLKVTDLPGTPVRLLTWCIQSLPAWVSQPLLSQALGRGRGGKMPSFHIDLHSGRGHSEVDYLNGAVVRAGADLGIATPINRWMNETLLALTDGTLPLDTYAHQPDRYLQAINSMEGSA